MSEGPIRAVDRPDNDAPWLDNAPVAAAWAPPQVAVAADDVAPRRARPARLSPAAVYGIVFLSLVLVAAGIWGLGGLKKRTDTLIATAPGELISTGPYELAFTEVTAQRSTNFDDSVYWKLTAIGTGRTTGSVTLAPSWSGAYGMFVSKDDTSKEVEQVSGANFGEEGADGSAFTPGLAPIRYTLEYKYAESYRPGPTLRMLVFELDYYDNSLLGDGDKAWHNSAYAHQLLLPVRVLPDATY